jgi:SAM-dependent methyltransferase
MNDMAWESGVCPLCRRESFNEIIHSFSTVQWRGRNRFWKAAPETLNIGRCSHCGLQYLSPRLSEDAMNRFYLSLSYFEGSAVGGYDSYAAQRVTLTYTFRWLARKLKAKGLTGGSLLDIGCGPGWFLREAEAFFEKRVGTDLCSEMVEEASSFCDRVILGGPDDLEGNEHFDLITAIGVLEHVYRPVSFVKSCRELLKDNGSLVLVTPDARGLWHRLMKKRWPSFKLPEHIAYYDRFSMDILATNTGMKLKSLFPYHQAFPLGLILRKLGFGFPERSFMHRTPLPLPAVMMATVFGRA